MSSPLASYPVASLYRSGAREVFLAPGNATGTILSAPQLEAAIAGGATTIRFGEGDFFLDAPLDIETSGISLVGLGDGRTRVRAGFSPSSADADEPTNALVRVRGSLTAFSTTLSARVPRDQETAALTSVAGLDSTFRVQGHNDPADEQTGVSSGDIVVLTELFEVASLSGSTATLTGPALQHHSTTNGGAGEAVTVRGVQTVDDVVIEGIDFLAPGGTLAVGVLADYTRRLKIRDCGVEGYSRAALLLRLGTREFEIDGIDDRGETNCVLELSSAMLGSWRRIRSRADGLRFHALGIPRGKVRYRDRITEVRGGGDSHLRRGCRGMWIVGGIDISWRDLFISDFLDTELVAREPDFTEVLAPGIQEGTGPITKNENGKNWRANDVHLTNCRQSTVGFVDALGSASRTAWFIHDQQDMQYDNISVINDGLGPNTSGRNTTGFRIQDANGQIGRMFVKGCNWAVRDTGVHTDVDIDELTITASAGNPADAQATLGIDYSYGGGVNGNGYRVRKLRLSNITSAPWLYNAGGVPSGSSLTDFSGDDERQEETLDLDGLFYCNTRHAQTAGASVNVQGYLCDVGTTAGKRSVVAAGAATTVAKFVVAWPTASYGTNNTWVKGSLLPADECWVLCTTAAVVKGDLMGASATAGRAEQRNAACVANMALCIGRADSDKSAGAEGLVRLIPA